MTKEDFLIKTELYKKKPNNLSEKEIKDTFEQTLLYINSRPEGEKEDLIYKLAYSLGSGKKSSIRFHNLIESVNPSNDILDDVLDFIRR